VEEARIIRTCRRKWLAVPAAALAAASLAFAVALPAFAAALPASAATPDATALLAYVHARAADGDPSDLGARTYSAALASSPGNEILAAGALEQGLALGDEKLALDSAHILDTGGKLPAYGRLLLVADALRGGRWAAADAGIGRLQGDPVFGFAAPILRAWTIQGAGSGDPIALLDGLKGAPLAEAYAGEQRALLLLARGWIGEGVAALAPMIADKGIRADRLRIAAAASLARAGDPAGAEKMLAGDSGLLARARRQLAAGRLDGEIRAPAEGAADFLLRVAVDLNAQQAADLALDFGRVATFLAPRDGEAWLVTAELLGARGRRQGAIAALGHIPAENAFADLAAEQRLALLVDTDRKAEAIAQAQGAAAKDPMSVESWIRLGDVLVRSERHSEAASAFARALATRRGDDEAHPRWSLLLLEASALTEAGRWPEAKAALREAYGLAPHQPSLLNYLGYSELERRENLDEAERLIREASALQPDDMAITDSLGWALYVRGDVGRAIALLEKAALGQPSDPSINEHLGDAYYSAGRRYEARYAWRAALIVAEGKASTRLQAKIEAGLRPDLGAP
jgi:Flp pilus assembly protein TadD